MTADTLDIHLVNHTTSNAVFATVTGLAIDRGNAWFLLRSDGKTPYYPAAPSEILQPLTENCAIQLAGPGETRVITIPRIAGGRIYLSIDKPITFLLNPGPALVEPSVTNPTDANYHTNWSFMEFTYNHDQLYANISYVDFVGFPIALTLTTSAGAEKKVLGLARGGPERIAAGLAAQQDKDGQKWGDLVVKDDKGNLLRILSPNQGIVLNPSLFSGYFEPYIEDVWSHYRQHDLKLDTQCHFGVVSGSVNKHGECLTVDGLEFTKPTTRDIFNASSGPFQTGPDAKRNAIIPRLNAEFNRSVLLSCDCEVPSRKRGEYYRHDVTNHYARLVHDANVDGRGYAHPYDDVAASGGEDHSGFVNDGAPQKLAVIVGGEGD
ncbi:hypothetical protein H072_9991 [Dactylellina haptotyla CBS 200.50]|uniref:GH64 domain-containing protein n=1 Tax=Dactylellina haptotyla (strain CBS 200.50) TaxID=1284197 RepID=S8A196_DACHA|nr:hypothetical protein H072_9991 [Dactylellina haptotyla CBS 200.50]